MRETPAFCFAMNNDDHSSLLCDQNGVCVMHCTPGALMMVKQKRHNGQLPQQPPSAHLCPCSYRHVRPVHDRGGPTTILEFMTTEP